MNRLRICLVFPLRLRRFLQLLPLSLFALSGMSAQMPWSAIGPMGGDARALAAVPGQPHHLYLGTTNSWLYESTDSGASWHRLAKLDGTDDLILDHIVVDRANPATIFAAAWRLEHTDGGLWVSRDGGRSWNEVAGLHGQSIRAFTQAPSDPAVLFAGTLEGVFRSMDGGFDWTLISPPGSQEIHEVESLAIDPTDTNVIYAGTWHLPWKTSDGGKNWHNIKEGVIDDSDVFSIIIDPARPTFVFASACSGIYKSVNSGELFKRIQGIPSTARRTRVLKQDPANSDVVYAGTTEGLYKTLDGGKSFTRLTGPEVIVNDVFVDPENTNHVVIATDRGGVLTSSDAGANFAASNEGFSGRKVEALLVERNHPEKLYAGVVNDKSFGGVFASGDGGGHWRQIDAGLDGLDVFALSESPRGVILAGTNHGIFALMNGADAQSQSWSPRNTILNSQAKPAVEMHRGRRINVEKQIKERPSEIAGRVYALDLSSDAWLASTTGGLFTSRDQGATWQGGPALNSVDFLSVAAHGGQLVAAKSDEVALSTDGGQSWMPIGIPAMLTRIHCVAFSADGTLWLGAQEGVYFSRDTGKTWMWVNRFPLSNVDDLSYDAHLDKILVSSQASDQIYAIDPKTLAWKWAQTGYRINRVRAAGERLMAASLFDGVLVETEKPGNKEQGTESGLQRE